jgi:hypothetical protein
MKYAASSGFILTQKSSGEKNCELGGYQGNKLGYILLELPSTAQRFSPMVLIPCNPWTINSLLFVAMPRSTKTQRLN